MNVLNRLRAEVFTEKEGGYAVFLQFAAFSRIDTIITENWQSRFISLVIVSEISGDKKANHA
jgi:hypothetical protein